MTDPSASPTIPAGTAGPWWSPRRRWATVVGVVGVLALLAAGILDDFARGLVVAAVIYLAFGLVRHRHVEGRWVLWQVPGVLLYGALTVWALSLDEPGLQLALAFGWVAHAAWDAVHYRANQVVPRWYAEMCIVVDVLIAVVLVVRA